jgi:hypothetical protein
LFTDGGCQTNPFGVKMTLVEEEILSKAAFKKNLDEKIMWREKQ